MTNCNTYFLSEIVDNFMIDRQISKKKYAVAFEVMAKKEWQKLFQNTLWSVQSKWMTLQKGDPYNFVYVPEGVSRLFSVQLVDRCKLLQPIFYNSQLNVINKPSVKKCGCKADCGCAGVCESANSTVYTTKVIFTINGVDYIEKTWLKYCPNGDVIEYRETPTKKYNNITGDGGDYDPDYNEDYSQIATPFTDFTIVTVTSQKKICKLETLECGCPKETTENEELLITTCGCNLSATCGIRKKRGQVFVENIDNNFYGEVKLSECGTKIYYRPSPKWKYVSDVEFPEFLLVSYQTNGLNIPGQVLVPDYALDTMEAGLYWRSIRFNTSIPTTVKADALAQYNMENDKLMGFLNPISLIELGRIQDIEIRW